MILEPTIAFPLAYASALGLDTLKMKMHLTGGVGSQANPTYYETLKIRLLFTDSNGQPHTAEFETLAGFTIGMDAVGYGLLGQLGFFENFAVGFNHAAKTFSIDIP